MCHVFLSVCIAPTNNGVFPSWYLCFRWAVQSPQAAIACSAHSTSGPSTATAHASRFPTCPGLRCRVGEKECLPRRARKHGTCANTTAWCGTCALRVAFLSYRIFFFFYELHPLLFFCCQSSELPNFKYLSESPAFLLFSFVVKSIFCAYFRYWCGTMQTMFLRLTIRQW